METNPNPVKLHLGCGDKYMEGYVNVDYPQSEHSVMKVKADLYSDMMDLSYPDNSVDEIRSHHLFEHFNRAQALKLLLRWRRWLKPNGLLWIETPDFGACARAYVFALSQRRKFQLWRHILGSQEAKWANHYDYWDKSKGNLVLKKLGFKNIRCKTYHNRLAQHYPKIPFLNFIGRFVPDSFYRKYGGHRLPNLEMKARKDADQTVDERRAVCSLLSQYLVGKEEEDLLAVWMKDAGFGPKAKSLISRQLKILLTVEFYYPKIGGAEEVVRQLAERLADSGHKVTVATTKLVERERFNHNGVRLEEFNLAGNKVAGIRGSAREIERYQKLLEGDFDVILNYAAQSWPTDLALDRLDKIKARKILVPCGYSGLLKKCYQDYFRELPKYLRHYDALVYMSPNYQDKKFGDEHGLADKSVLIPNGVASEEFVSTDDYDIRKKMGIKTPFLAISVSNHYKAKGHDFVLKAFRRMQRDDVSLLMIGELRPPRSFKEWGHVFVDRLSCFWKSVWSKNIYLVDGRNRQAVLSAYKNADLFLFGSQVECSPLVMYESFAAGTPFLTRPVGNVLDHPGAVEIATTFDEMSASANRLLDNPSLRADLIRNGKEIWQGGHDWQTIVGQYEELFNKLLG